MSNQNPPLTPEQIKVIVKDKDKIINSGKLVKK